MSWVKRNLYFLIGAGVALALLGVAGFYLYTKWKLNNDKGELLEKDYAEWKHIVGLEPNPGNDKVDNIKLADEQTATVRAQIANVHKHFVPTTAVPDKPQVSKDEFATALRTTIDRLQKDASSAGVTLPRSYWFSFEAQHSLTVFAKDSLGPLSVQLGEVKSICDILFRSKINTLEALRRERVSSDDNQGPLTDYLDTSLTSVTNELAVLTPYEMTFRCFGAELSGVLTGFATAPNGFIVKTLNVEPVGTGVATTDATAAPTGYMPGYGAAAPGGYPPGAYPPGAVPPGSAAATAGRSGTPPALDEHPLKVTMVLTV